MAWSDSHFKDTMGIVDRLPIQMLHASAANGSVGILQLKMDILGNHQPQSLTFADMEVACHLVTGPVYLAGETITCRVSVINNATTSKVF